MWAARKNGPGWVLTPLGPLGETSPGHCWRALGSRRERAAQCDPYPAAPLGVPLRFCVCAGVGERGARWRRRERTGAAGPSARRPRAPRPRAQGQRTGKRPDPYPSRTCGARVTVRAGRAHPGGGNRVSDRNEDGDNRVLGAARLLLAVGAGRSRAPAFGPRPGTCPRCPAQGLAARGSGRSAPPAVFRALGPGAGGRPSPRRCRIRVGASSAPAPRASSAQTFRQRRWAAAEGAGAGRGRPRGAGRGGGGAAPRSRSPRPRARSCLAASFPPGRPPGPATQSSLGSSPRGTPAGALQLPAGTGALDGQVGGTGEGGRVGAVPRRAFVSLPPPSLGPAPLLSPVLH